MRPDWDEYFMDIVEVVRRRSTCLRRQVGAVIVKDKQILSTGYNGAPIGCTHCTDIGSCMRNEEGIPSGERYEYCRASHAEQNAISQAARNGVPTNGSTLYCNFQPCIICARMIINAGIVRVVYQNPVPDELTLSMFNEAGVEVVVIK